MCGSSGLHQYVDYFPCYEAQMQARREEQRLAEETKALEQFEADLKAGKVFGWGRVY